MTTAGNTFLDTNILLRATLPIMPLHREAVSLVTTQRTVGARLWISRQIIREYIAVVTRPQTFLTPLSMGEVTAQIQIFERLFIIADDTAEVTAHLLALLQEHPTGGKQVHDANVVATMLAFGISTLLTQNVDDMRRFSGKIVIIPLHAAPS
ncbi:MAG TPA: PIN domain-containing protein [Thermomicrobiales bacterium]|jgi:predicted nucleic acid-binding protein